MLHYFIGQNADYTCCDRVVCFSFDLEKNDRAEFYTSEENPIQQQKASSLQVPHTLVATYNCSSAFFQSSVSNLGKW